MADTASIKITKSSPYKGGTQEWSNRYHFTGGDPGGTTPWDTLRAAVILAEKRLFLPETTIVRADGYAPGSDLPVYSWSGSVAGIYSLAGGALTSPLEVAGLLRWSTDQRTVKNHPIFLFSYMRSAIRAPGSDHEALYSDYLAECQGYAAAWLAGFSDGSVTHKRAGPHGAVAQAYLVATQVTHRDFT